ncbi:MAG: methylated-DNA--[protein]-cysteine S-methyltransferase [Bacteroidales bacterium]|nr:methylated-DNA--[protein]-cysteine S-methyltransferase [Bacteroidales bacterium]
MDSQNSINFGRIARAIAYINANFRSQPDLDQIAAAVHISPFHFQRLFTAWAGVSPKKFLQYISVEYAKKMLRERDASLLDTAIETGLSGTGRLHDLFITIEGMTPGEYKNGGKNLLVHYSFAESPFGDILIASTPKGICHLAFADNKNKALGMLKESFPRAGYRQKTDPLHQQVLSVFKRSLREPVAMRLHLKGTGFQLKVWEALLKIPMGHLSTYGEIATHINHPKAVRAVGTAIGVNPVAYLIPCHRVIRSNGASGQYHWGTSRKVAMIGWEAAKSDYLTQP